MLLRQMKYFQSVVETGSFTEAAEACYISQSAISQQIAALEAELGARLLERKGRRAALTPAGDYFYKRSLLISAELEQLVRETRRRGSGEGEKLRVGVLSSFGGDEFVRAVSAFAERYPEVELEVLSGNHEELYEALRMGRADLVLNDQRRAFSDQYENRILRESVFFVEVSVHNPLSRLEGVEVGDLRSIPCILVASEQQEEGESAFYREIIGFGGEFLYARTLQEARVLVISNRGVLPVEGAPGGVYAGATFRHVPLLREGQPISRNTCAFRLKSNENPYAAAFEDLLAGQFAGRGIGE